MNQKSNQKKAIEGKQIKTQRHQNTRRLLQNILNHKTFFVFHFQKPEYYNKTSFMLLGPWLVYPCLCYSVQYPVKKIKIYNVCSTCSLYRFLSDRLHYCYCNTYSMNMRSQDVLVCIGNDLFTSQLERKLVRLFCQQKDHPQVKTFEKTTNKLVQLHLIFKTCVTEIHHHPSPCLSSPRKSLQ